MFRAGDRVLLNVEDIEIYMSGPFPVSFFLTEVGQVISSDRGITEVQHKHTKGSWLTKDLIKISTLTLEELKANYEI